MMARSAAYVCIVIGCAAKIQRFLQRLRRKRVADCNCSQQLMLEQTLRKQRALPAFNSTPQVLACAMTCLLSSQIRCALLDVANTCRSRARSACMMCKRC